MKKKLFVFTSVLLTSLLFSCTKDFIEKKEADEIKIAADSTNLNGKDSGKDASKGYVVYSTTFDWENLNQISTPTRTILLPWYGSNKLPARMRHNHPKSDGWEMLYNTMDLSGIGSAPTFFALYNKYSGVMHLFYISLTYLESAQHFYTALGLTGNTSLMNFEGKQNNSLNVKNYYPTIVKGTEATISPFYTSAQLNIPDASFVWDTWYGTEIEFAYEDVSSFSDLTFYLQYLPFRGTYQSLSLTGTLAGSIKGTIEAKSSGNTNLIGSIPSMFSSSNNTNIKVDNGSSVEDIVTSAEKAKQQGTPTFWSKLWNKIHTAIPTAVENNLTSTLTQAITLGLNWATNPLSAFVKSVFSNGTTSSIPLEKVDLKIDTKILLEGSISSQYSNSNFYLKLPNTISVFGGYGYPTLEMKDWNLGVWNVANLPTAISDINNIIPHYGQPYSEISIDLPGSSSASIVINPKVLADCNITQQTIGYRISCSSMEIKNLLDNLEPFSFTPDGLIQTYVFPNYAVLFSLPYTLSNSNNWSVYANVTLVLTHKTTGQIFVYRKDFPLQNQSVIRETYLPGEPGDPGEIW